MRVIEVHAWPAPPHRSVCVLEAFGQLVAACDDCPDAETCVDCGCINDSAGMDAGDRGMDAPPDAPRPG